MQLTHATKEAAKGMLFGVLGQVGRVRGVSGTPIITYHSLDDLGSTMSMPPDCFRRQMEHLKHEGFTSLRLSDYITALRDDLPLPEKSFVLTFDDGFESVYDVAFPVLEELGFTATIFPITSYVGLACGWEIGERNLQVGADRLRLMSWDQIEEMNRHGFEFGSHGVYHLHMSRQLHEVVSAELVQSRHMIEEQLGTRCSTFCYPYGDFGPQTPQIVEEAGYDAAVTLKFGWNDHASDRFTLRRVGSARFTNLQVFNACMYRMYGWHLRGHDGHR